VGTKIDRVPVAILDTYDGAVWGTDASFALVGHQMPVGPTVPVAGRVVRQQYLVGSDGSSFLPALERPVEATGHSLVFDRVSGMIATATPAPAGFGYTVDSELPNLGHVATEPVKSGNDPHFSALALPPQQGWPDSIVAFANGITGKGPYATLQAVANELRSRDFGYSSTARPGHSLGVLSAFLAPPTTLNQASTARVGDAEQFAAAFAVIARIKGFPSRVVVGYKVNPTAAAKGALIQVLPDQISAWAEVDLNGIGWVTFDPTNAQPRHSTLRSAPPPPPPPAPVGISFGNGHGHGTNPNGRGVQHRSSEWWIFIPVVLLLLPVVVVGAKRIRRHRRASSGSPLSRVVGAWREARERLRLHGVRLTRSMTIDEIVVETRNSMGDDVANRVQTFGPILNTSLYSPSEPDEDAVASAWDAEGSMRALLNENASVRQRLLVALDPRSLARTR
jgi:transglutaminase-like putative cysteine protease